MLQEIHHTDEKMAGDAIPEGSNNVGKRSPSYMVPSKCDAIPDGSNTVDLNMQGRNVIWSRRSMRFRMMVKQEKIAFMLTKVTLPVPRSDPLSRRTIKALEKCHRKPAPKI